MTSKLGTAAHARIKELRKRQEHPEEHMPVSTGLVDLDAMINGGLPRDTGFLLTIVGREKKGKSTLGKQLFLKYCEETHLKGCIYDLEESEDETVDRAMVMRATFTSRTEIYKVQLTETHFQELEEIATQLDNQNVYIIDSLYFVNQIFKHMEDNEIEIACIDNFQLLMGGKGDSERQQLQDLSKQFMMKRKQGKRLFVLAQGSPDDKKSFGSGQLLKDSNIVLWIEAFYKGKGKARVVVPGYRVLRIEHSRFSEGGECDVLFLGAFSRVAPLTFVEEPVETTDFLNYEITDYEQGELYGYEDQ